jgi:glycosyltransferase involved in cell wall biosynthesis
VIVGFSPFNPLFFILIPVVRKNNAVFFTSWPGWTGKERAPVGFTFLKDAWEGIVKKYFSAAACVNLESLRYWEQYLPSYLMEHSIKTEEYLVKKEYPGTNRFIFLGRKARCKNLDVLINIVAGNPDIHMDIAGDTKFKEEDGDSRIRFLGMRDKNWIKRNLRKYDALVLPSDWLEAFGLVLLEAMAAGVPVIVTPTAGTETIFRNKRYRFMADSSGAHDIEKAIVSFLRASPEERRETGEMLRQIAKNYSTTTIRVRWMEMLRDISERSRSI